MKKYKYRTIEIETVQLNYYNNFAKRKNDQ